MDAISPLLTSVLGFIILLTPLIFLHELGHLIAAKIFKMKVDVFSVGFGKRLIGFKWGGTDYRISLFPLGGYVELWGENPHDNDNNPTSFQNKPRWQRLIVFFAGPLMNLIVSLVIITGILIAGTSMSQFHKTGNVVGFVEDDSPAHVSELIPGDEILELDGEKVKNWNDVAFLSSISPDKEMNIVFKRSDEFITSTIIPDKLEIEGQVIGYIGAFPKIDVQVVDLIKGGPAELSGIKRGDILTNICGVQILQINDAIDAIRSCEKNKIPIEIMSDGTVFRRLELSPGTNEDGVKIVGVNLGIYTKLGVQDSITRALQFNNHVFFSTFKVIGKIFKGETSAKNTFTGPIGIARIGGGAIARGAEYFLFLMAFISTSLAIMNILPIPVLDGGQITVLTLEMVRRKDFSLKTKMRIQNTGLIILFALISLILYFDIEKLF